MGLLKARPGAEAEAAPPSAGDVLAGLASPEAGQRRAAAQALASPHSCPLASPAEAVPLLAAALRSEQDRPAQEAMLAALITLATPEAVAALLALLRAEDAWLRNAALAALQAVGEPAAAALRGLLAAEEADWRIMALSTLAGLRCAAAEGWILTLLETEPDANVCAAGVETLDRIGSAAAAAPLEALALRFAHEPFLAYAARAVRARLLPDGA
ncbi:HEAT repeat domain-containing protein [Roseomonas sp. GC11]|uniref:HEAT repeat domain-containing protein n=1 Tax=Roseomonas sp. GC11 TaxID=2950546 RepID=UPI00210DBD4C|nr:HEAT repeat domain-containing protein [Roseomonas sp. GC11]MCQ4162874.1 HEAT repeat domain-containing protein [Roseomonas sp. GC11]